MTDKPSTLQTELQPQFPFVLFLFSLGLWAMGLDCPHSEPVSSS